MMHDAIKVRTPGSDPMPALEEISARFRDEGKLCSLTAIDCAIEELKELREKAFDPKVSLAAALLLLAEEWGVPTIDHYCPTCMSWEPGWVPKDSRGPQYDHEGHWPGCARGLICARLRDAGLKPEDLVRTVYGTEEDTGSPTDTVNRWLHEERDRLRKALQWYADGCPVGNVPGSGEPMGFTFDGGKRAKEALAR